MALDIASWKRWYEEHREEILEDFFQFLRFKSIGADSAFDNDTKKCASWLANYLRQMGLDVQLWESSGQPVIFASCLKAGEDRPTILIYHHYDVQPVDPLNLWESDPFEPVVKEGEVYARGAQDNKGQCFYSITAIRAFLQLAQEMRFNLKVFIEGEEESSSAGTYEVLKKKGDALKSDSLLVVDLGIPEANVGAITLGIRGILPMEVHLRTADVDMHSGAMGGVACNPIRVLIEAFATMWDENGKIAIPNFFADVIELSEEEKNEFDFSLNESQVRKDFGLRGICPEPGYTIGESVSIRPTLEMNGICGGYTGEGFKTVLPAVASAKISCRLVPGQDPEKIFSSIKAHLQKQIPKEMDFSITADHGSFAFRSDQNSNIAKVAAKAYEEVLGKPCKKILTGGSIPVVTELARISGAEAVMMGYGLDTDQIHAPNEHFGLDRFEKGFLTVGRILSLINEE